MSEKYEKVLSVADVETTQIEAGEIPKTKFWGFYDGTTYRRFPTSRDFAKFLRQSQTEFLILHHSNFDIIQLLVDGVEIDLLKTHNGKLIVSRYDRHNFLNSYAVFPLPLSEIFAAFGYKKTSLDNLKLRNYEDCVNGLECLTKLDAAFQAVAGVSPIQRHTIASASFRAAEKVAGRLPKCLEMEQAYRGGRVEAYHVLPPDIQEKIGELRHVGGNRLADKLEAEFSTSAHCHDINSSYPYSFLDAPAESVLWKVRVKTSDWFCPLFDANNFDMLQFPNGVFESYVYRDVWEKYLEPHAEKTTIKILERWPVHSLKWFEPVKQLVLDVFALKQKHSDKRDAIYMASKLFLNSMYGRIGLRGEREQAKFVDAVPDKDDVLFYKIGRRYLVFYSTQDEPRSNFPLAAYITDNARGRLYQAAKLNGAIYCDTDSVFSSSKHFKGKQGGQCGQWSSKGESLLAVYNVKDYVFDGEDTRKGGHEFLQWTLKDFAGGRNVSMVKRERQTALQKRKVLPDGSTIPHVVNQTTN